MSSRPAVESLYRSTNGLELHSYAEQQRVLFEGAYGYSNGFSRGMKQLGHDAHEVVYDLEVLQKAWAKEKGVVYDQSRWQSSIIMAQIDYLKPDILYFQDIRSLPHPIRATLKSEFPFIKLIVIHRGYPGLNPPTLLEELSDADVLLVGSPTLAMRCKDAGMEPRLVYHSFDESILPRLADSDSSNSPTHDFTFSGVSGIGFGDGHFSRYWFLLELTRQTALELWVHERAKSGGGKVPLSYLGAKELARSSAKRILKGVGSGALDSILSSSLTPGKLRKVAIDVKQETKAGKNGYHAASPGKVVRPPVRLLSEEVPRRCHPPVFGVDMYALLKNSRVTLNSHSDAADGNVDNLRLFQATGVGTCLLTDTGENMPDLFEEDREVVTYSSIDECVEKADYLLEHDNVRQDIAAAGQARTLKYHTAMQRCLQIDEIMQRAL